MLTLTHKILPIFISAGIGVLLLSPLPYGTVQTWSLSFFEIVSFLTLGAWCTREILSGKIRIPHSPLYIPFGLFFILIIFQVIPLSAGVLKFISPHTDSILNQSREGLNYVFGDNLIRSFTISINPYATREKLVLYFSYAAFFIVASNYLVSRQQLKRYFWIIFAVATLQSLIGIFQYIGVANQHAASGTYVNPNHFAGFLLLIIPLTLGYVLYLGQSRSSGKGIFHIMGKSAFSNQILLFFATCLMGTALIMSQSRGAILSALASLAIFYVLFTWKKQNRSGLFFITLFIAIIAVYSIWIGVDPVIEKFSETQERLPKRTYIWKDTLSIIKDFPFFGTGLGTYSLSFSLYKNATYWPRVIQHAHNDFLELLSETGIVGFILIMWGIIGFYKKVISQIIHNAFEKDTLRYFLILGCISGSLGMMLHVITDFNFQIPANAYYFTFLIAISTSMSNLIEERNIP